MQKVRSVRLPDSKLCVNCENTIYSGRQCPSCGSRSFQYVSAIINRNFHEYPFHGIDLSIYPPEKLRDAYPERYAS